VNKFLWLFNFAILSCLENLTQMKNTVTSFTVISLLTSQHKKLKKMAG